MSKLQLPIVKFTKEHEQFRQEVRDFLEEEKNKGTFDINCDSWLSGYSEKFSKRLGEQGYIGMTWPKEYGGSERSAVERYILVEELLAYGAPVALHWFGDRQTGPLFLNYGTEEQKQRFVPRIAKGECYFAIGLSEPNSGSDLASITSRAEKVEGGWRLTGQKIWSSGAHHCDYMLTLCRTRPFNPETKHEGMSQLIVDLKAEGVTVRPIKFLTGEYHFNEVFFENVFVPDENLIGEEGNGWKQALAELAFERSGPERILSTLPLLNEMINVLREENNVEGLKRVAPLVAKMYNYRLMSIGVAQLLEEKANVNEVAALVKDMGTEFEKSVAEIARAIIESAPTMTTTDVFERFLAQSILHGPGFTLRGGTNEILRGIVAKGLVR